MKVLLMKSCVLVKAIYLVMPEASKCGNRVGESISLLYDNKKLLASWSSKDRQL